MTAALATIADLLALPDDMRAELVDGQLIVEPTATAEHAKAAGALRYFIGGPFDDEHGHNGPGGWWIFPEVLVQFGAEVRRPDLAGWRRERLESPGRERPIRVIPDWCCEVISPGNAGNDRVRKRRLYAQHGVQHYWLVDPWARTIEALQLHDGLWLECGAWGEDSHDARIPPFEEVALDLARLFLPRES